MFYKFNLFSLFFYRNLLPLPEAEERKARKQHPPKAKLKSEIYIKRLIT